MKWTKRKKLLESFLCDSLKNRIEYHCARYRHAHDGQGRVWITFDKKEIFSMSFTNCVMYHYWKIEDETLTSNEKIDIKEHELHKDGIFCPHDFKYAFDAYLNIKIEDALESNDFLVQALAAFDFRIGKRRLIDIKQRLNQLPEWLQSFYMIRLTVDCIE